MHCACAFEGEALISQQLMKILVHFGDFSFAYLLIGPSQCPFLYPTICQTGRGLSHGNGRELTAA
jgi:hypothetical protein